MVVLSGPAVISDRTAPQWLPEIGEAYRAKYAEAMVAYGMGLEPIAEKFHVVIELVPTDLWRGEASTGAPARASSSRR